LKFCENRGNQRRIAGPGESSSRVNGGIRQAREVA